MKFAPTLCLCLAFLSPAAALRGSLRQLQETTEPVEEAVEEVVEDTEESLVVIGGMPEKRAIPTLPPTTAPPEGTKPEATEVYEYEHQIESYALYSSEARKGKSKKSYKDKKDEKDDFSPPEPDALCEDFCQRYMNTCEGANDYFNPEKPRGTSAGRRRLIAGSELDVPRLSGSVFESLHDCLGACMGFPRPTNPADYLDPEELGVNSIGDTFWCRDTHLKLAERNKKEHFGAQTHCPFASPSGGGLCTNVVVDSVQMHHNASAYEFVRAGAKTARHIGFCQMYFNDVVADCTSAGINDLNFDLVLALIPTETEILILNNNVGKRDPITGNTIGEGITTIKDEQFRSLLCPSCIKALIIDDGEITTLTPTSFTALNNLESLSLNMQLIDSLPTGLLANNPNLREFSIYNTPSKAGKLTSIPANLFTQRARNIQRIVISGHRNLAELPPLLFDSLFDLTILILSNNGLTNDGIIQPLMFQSLSALQIWDMSNNQFTVAEKEWVNSGWAWSLTNFYLHSNPLETLEDGIFDNFDTGKCLLEVVLLHNTDLKTVPIGVFDFCTDTLISYTLSNRV